jgi:hypothetical protein
MSGGNKNAMKFYTWLATLTALALVLAACGGSPSPTVMPEAATQAAAETQAPVASPTPAAPTSQPAPTEASPSPEVTQQASTQAVAPVVGVEMHHISVEGGLSQVKEMGAHWIRRNALLWSEVEPQLGARNWEAVAGLETELRNAAEQGLETILIVRSTPAWAQKNPGVSCGPVSQGMLPAFAIFMQDLVERYSAAPYNVKYYELGNEPDIDPSLVKPDNIFGCWGDLNAPYYGGQYYADMLKAVYPQVKAANPDAQVVIGGLLLDCDPTNPPESPAGSGQYADCTPARFLEGILENGGGDFFDVVSFHAYDYYIGSLGRYGNLGWHSKSNTTGPVLIEKTGYLRNLLAAHGYPDKGLINSESAVLCSGEEAKCVEETFEESKSIYVAQAYASARAEGLLANIWYSIRGWRFSGLVNQQGEPLPAAAAMKFSASQLNQAVFEAQLSQFPGLMGYAYQRDGARLWILWALEADQTIDLGSVPAQMYDIYGNEIPTSQQITVGVEPVYILW